MGKIKYDEEARKKLVRGIEALTKVVSTTLGPRGRNVGIRAYSPDGKFFEDIIVHDGVTCAKAVRLKDLFEDFGASIVRQAAERQVNEVGDGTTVTVILAEAIIKESMQLMATGVNPMSLRRGLEEARDKVLAGLDKEAIPIKTREEKVKVATIASEDEGLGEMIGRVLHKIGSEGVITVEESKSSETTIEHQEGMQFEGGYISPYFISNPRRMEATVKDTYILITDKGVANIIELAPLLDALVRSGTPRIVIIAPGVTDSALGSLIVNKMQGKLAVSCVKAPGIESTQSEFLQDIAILTGGQVVTKEGGMRFEELVNDAGQVKFEHLGHAGRVTSNKEATIIVEGKGSDKDIRDRVKSLRRQLEDEESDFNKEKIEERIAKLSSGVAVLRVGGSSAVEIRDKKERAIDAVAATKAAIEEGIVAGGEISLLQARKSIEKSKDSAFGILANSLLKPFDKLVSNAGEESAVRRSEVLKAPKNYGVDVIDGQMKDMIEAGILDPVKVLKEAVRNAVSVAIKVISTGAVIIPTPPDKKDGKGTKT